MIEHLINSNGLKKNRNKEVSPKPKRDNVSSFGPSLGKLKQLDITKKVRKMIHYDCNENANLDGIDDDVPDEDEVYVKENLLMNLKEKQLKDKENHITESNNEDPSIVNINVSILYSEETLSNSKNNSLTFNYSPDSTSRMNHTKDQFNSAKKTLRSYLNKSNSNNNLLTENTFTFNTQNSNFNTLNSNNSKDKKGESPGNPYLMEKIASLLNKNNKTQINNNIMSNVNLDNSSRPNTNRDFIRNEFNNVNIQNLNYTNNNLSPKNLVNINNSNTNNAIVYKTNKVISDNLNKNLLYIMQSNSNKKLNNENSDKKEQTSSGSNNQKQNFVNLSKLKNANDSKAIAKDTLTQKRSLNPADYLSPPSSKKRLEDKFYNYTENKCDPKISHFTNFADEKTKNELMIKQTFTNAIQSRQKEFITTQKNSKAAKFDFSRYNYKSQDLTGLINQKKKTNENEIFSDSNNNNNNNNTAERNKIISNDSKGGEKSKSHSRDKSDNTIGLSKSNNTCNLIGSANLLEKMRVSDKKIFINTLDDNKNIALVNKNLKQNLNQAEAANVNRESGVFNSPENQSVEKEAKKSAAELHKENLAVKVLSDKTVKDTKPFKAEKEKEKEKEKSTVILRDVKSLRLITQKALTAKSNIYLEGDTIEEEKKKTILSSNSTKKALYIDDNSDMPVGIAKSQDPLIEAKDKENLVINYDNIICKTDSNLKSPNSNSFTFSNSLSSYNISEKDRKQIINIININNNYNIGNLNFNLNENIYSITNPNSNVKETNSKNKYNAFLTSKESNKSKNISNSHSNNHKSKNRINNANNNASHNGNKNVSAFNSNIDNTNVASSNNHFNKNYFENSSSNTNSNNVSSLNNLNSNILFKQQHSANNSNSNISGLKNFSDLNSQTLSGKYTSENRNIAFNRENNLNLNAINEYLNSSKEKAIPNTSKNSINSANNTNFLMGISSSNNFKHLVSDNKIKDILKSYKKEENSNNKNKFIKISSILKK